MLNDKNRWYAEWALDAVSTVVLGWFIVGPIVAALFPVPADGGDLVQFVPILIQAAVTYGFWKLFRSFNWLKGTPPSP